MHVTTGKYIDQKSNGNLMLLGFVSRYFTPDLFLVMCLKVNQYVSAL